MAEDGSQRYEKIDYLGEGQFATVYKAKDQKTGEIVAIKKIKIGSRAEASDGIHRTAIREIKILQEIRHPNVIGLQNVFGYKNNISLVFDFMETDLEVIIRDTKIILTMANVKAYTIMTLQGVEYLHRNWILHRDLKPNNLLINSEGVLKIGDFGLAKQYGSPSRPYTHTVVTRWYRCPELLFGARWYSTGVDMWAVGCILAELLIRAPLFQGDSDLDQLLKIFQVMGTPTPQNWPQVASLPDYIKFNPMEKQPLKSIFIAASSDVLEVLESMLTLNPLGRCDASQALQMPYFSSKPGPTPCAQLPRPSSNKIVSEMGLKAGSKRKLNEAGGLAKKLIF